MSSHAIIIAIRCNQCGCISDFGLAGSIFPDETEKTTRLLVQLVCPDCNAERTLLDEVQPDKPT